MAAQEEIARAGQLIASAANQWDAADISHIKNCVSALESSIAALTAASGTLKELPQNQGHIVRAMLTGISKDANRLQRLVDSSSAFLRNLPGTEYAGAGLYEPGGSTQLIGSTPDSWRLLG